MDPSAIEALLRRTEVLRGPRRMLSTFGATRISYHLISNLKGTPDSTRIRKGAVVSQRPQIVTPDSFKDRFQGFGDSAAEFEGWVNAAYKDLLRVLEYNFKNEGFSATVVSEKSPAVAERVLAELERTGDPHAAVLRCPDAGWSLALMKLTLEESARSFPVHVRDLERRGLFDPEGKKAAARRREIEGLFAEASSASARRDALAGKLREYGLFEEYEDRFLALF
ncbi:MAG: hypothetical protein HZB91_11470 [Elusimicrobia bacterium]|nr:hypothetical protein [Elusimicrobiota bacterium]